MKIAMYPGTFDPITLGQSDIIQRARALVDRLLIGVAINRDKGPMFTLEERVEMVERECAPIARDTATEIVAHPFGNLLIHCAEEVDAAFIVRGLRAVSDFEYEFQLAGMNHYLMPNVDTVFLTPTDQFQFISGTLVREIAMFGGDVSRFVSPAVAARLDQKRKERAAGR